MKNIPLLNDLKNYEKTNLKDDIAESKLMANKLKLKSSIIFTYGSTPYSTFESVYNAIKSTPKRFVVVGSSTGWVNFYWNDLNPTIETVGIDLHQGRLDFRKNLINKYNLKNIAFYNKDYKNFEFRNGDLIWQSNLCFPSDEVKKINNIILEKTPNISIISYRPMTTNKEARKYIKKQHHPCSWNPNQTFYVYEKI